MEESRVGIGYVAAKAGVSPRVLRYYEQQGLVDSTRTSAGHRRYDTAVVDRVLLIRTLFDAGLSSKAIRRVLPHVDAGESSPDLVRFLAGERARVQREIDDLLAVRTNLDEVIDAATNPDHPCAGSRSGGR